jgi:phage tail-like protein
MSAINNPVGAFSFMVAINGVPVSDFEECRLPSVSFDVLEYRQGGDAENNAHKLPGLVRYGNLVLKRGLTPAPGTMALWDWVTRFIQGTGSPTQVSVTLLDGKRNPLFQWQFSNAWPVKLESPVLNGKTSALAIETLEIAVEGMQVSAPSQGA